MQIGFHTDAFNSSYWSFSQCLDWARANEVPFIECGAIDGVSWIHGLGYQPHIALWEYPVLLRRKMDAVSYTHLRAHETVLHLVCRLLFEQKKQQ